MRTRKLTHQQKQKLLQLKKKSLSALIRDRAQAVLTRREGFSIKETAQALQRSEWFVKESLKKFGAGTLASTQLTSHNHRLSPVDRKAIIKTIQTKTPKILGFGSQFWTMRLVKDWLNREYRVTYRDEKSYRTLLQQAGFTFHKPKPVDYRQNRGQLKSFKGALKKSLSNTSVRFSW